MATDQITKQGIHKICAESGLDMRTVAKAYAGGSVAMGSWTLIRMAAAKLGLPMPPDPTVRHREGA